jgi:hypothetical protein
VRCQAFLAGVLTLAFFLRLSSHEVDGSWPTYEADSYSHYGFPFEALALEAPCAPRVDRYRQALADSAFVLTFYSMDQLGDERLPMPYFFLTLDTPYGFVVVELLRSFGNLAVSMLLFRLFLCVLGFRLNWRQRDRRRIFKAAADPLH